MKNDTATTATAIRIVLGCIGRRIVPPDHNGPSRFTGEDKEAPVRAD
jgi:hypothetical protein